MISEYIHFDFDFYYKAGWHDSIPELTEKQQECIADTIARLDTMCHLCKCQYYPWRPDMLPYPPEIKYRNRSCQHGTLLNEFMSRMVIHPSYARTVAKTDAQETEGYGLWNEPCMF
jgi:hypothetical protein